jgi:hypothetical protein
VRSNIEYVKELDLDYIRSLDSKNPLNIALKVLESPEFKNSDKSEVSRLKNKLI